MNVRLLIGLMVAVLAQPLSGMAPDLHPSAARCRVSNCQPGSSLAYIREQWQLIEIIHDPHDLKPVHALGHLLHAVQDFYA